MRRPAFRNLLLLAALLLSFQISIPRAASAENRVALVIGQSNYHAVPALPNAANDGKNMVEALGKAGYQVTPAADLSQTEMRQTISDFAAKVAASGPDTVALVFYAGHGLQIDGENYLIPVDVDPKREADIPLQAVRLNDLMNTLGALPTRMRIYLLDACRNNPFPALSQSSGHGLAIVNTKAGAPGSFISFSTSPGAEAEDGNGEDSPYTAALLKVANEPNLQIEEVLKRVRVAVFEATEGRQVPWDSSSLIRSYVLFLSGLGAGPEQDEAASKQQAEEAASTPQAKVTRTVDDWRKELKDREPQAAFRQVIEADSVAAYEAFSTLFAQSSYAPRARSLMERRKEMEAWEVAVATNTSASFDAFLASYAASDLAATAHKLQLRVFNRTLLIPTTVALGPTCPCPVLPTQPLLKKVEPTPPSPKRVDTTPPKGKKQRKGDDDVVERGSSGPPPGVIVDTLIGLGGIAGGMRGGGMHGGGMSGGGGMHTAPVYNNPRY